MKKIFAMSTLVALSIAIVVDQTYRTSLVDERVVAKTVLACKYTHGNVPPKKFTSDGCSMFPEGFASHTWEACCVAHDMVYWCGGEPAKRADADAELARCVHDAVPYIAPIMEAGVRVGGVSWLPTPWRWGYGWNFWNL